MSLVVQRRRIGGVPVARPLWPVPQAQSLYLRTLPRTQVGITSGGTVIQAASVANDRRGITEVGPDAGGIPGLTITTATRQRYVSDGNTITYNVKLSRPVAIYSLRLTDFDCTDRNNGGCQGGCFGSNGNRVGETGMNMWPPVRGATPVPGFGSGDVVNRKDRPQNRPVSLRVPGREHFMFGDTYENHVPSKIATKPGHRSFWGLASGCNAYADLQFGGYWGAGIQADISLPTGLGGGYSIMEFGAEQPMTPCVPYTDRDGTWTWHDARTGVALTPAEIATIDTSSGGN